MSRKFSVKISKEDLASRIVDLIEQHEEYDPEDLEGCRSDYKNDILFMRDNQSLASFIPILTDQIVNDLNKVEFSTENLEITSRRAYCGAKIISGFQKLGNGLTYLGITAGGDWELPIFFIIYYDGLKLRAYIPKNGNTWNHRTKSAFGNGEDCDEERDSMSQFNLPYQDVRINVNCDDIIGDMKSRIIYSGN